jgi:hypothetical protein
MNVCDSGQQVFVLRRYYRRVLGMTQEIGNDKVESSNVYSESQMPS